MAMDRALLDVGVSVDNLMAMDRALLDVGVSVDDPPNVASGVGPLAEAPLGGAGGRGSLPPLLLSSE